MASKKSFEAKLTPLEYKRVRNVVESGQFNTNAHFIGVASDLLEWVIAHSTDGLKICAVKEEEAALVDTYESEHVRLLRGANQ